MYCKILGIILGLNFFNTQIVLNKRAIQKIQQIQQPIEIIKVEKDSKEFAKRTKIKFRSNDGVDYFVEIFEENQELLTTKEKTCVGPSAYLVINTTCIEDIKLHLCSEERKLMVNLLNTWLLQNENVTKILQGC